MTNKEEYRMVVVKLGASVICMNFLNLREQLSILEQERIDFLHYDVMDGCFVPRMGLNVEILGQISRLVSIPIEVHLMVQSPMHQVDAFAEAGASLICFHLESADDPYSTIDTIRRWKIGAGIAISPCTPALSLDETIDLVDMVLVMNYGPGMANQSSHPGSPNKLKKLQLMIKEHDKRMLVGIDGGVNKGSIPAYIGRASTILYSANPGSSRREVLSGRS